MENQKKVYPIAARYHEPLVAIIIALIFIICFSGMLVWFLITSIIDGENLRFIICYSIFLGLYLILVTALGIRANMMTKKNKMAFRYTISITEDGTFILYNYNNKKVLIDADKIYKIKVPSIDRFARTSPLMLATQAHKNGVIFFYFKDGNKKKKIKMNYIKDVKIAKAIILDYINRGKVTVDYDLTGYASYYE